MSDTADRRILVQEESAGADSFGAQLEVWRLRMEDALASRLPDQNAVPARLHEAMRYSVLGGGKRIRPALLFATARTLGLSEDDVEAAACAIELVHVYSLVHDDLPSMDDDDLRRGRPTCHKAYDEATALLVGDALQPLAFQLLATDPKLPAAPAIRLRLIDLLAGPSAPSAWRAGKPSIWPCRGCVSISPSWRTCMSARRERWIRASVLMAAECVPRLDPNLYAALTRFAVAVGLAFQIQDDLLDVIGDVTTLGKATGADSERAKPRIRPSSAYRPRNSGFAICTVRPSMRWRPSASAPQRCAPSPIGCCRGSTDRENRACLAGGPHPRLDRESDPRPGAAAGGASAAEAAAESPYEIRMLRAAAPDSTAEQVADGSRDGQFEPLSGSKLGGMASIG